MSQYYIEHNYIYGWDDAGWRDWEIDDVERVTLFNSLAEANEAIDEFIADQHEAVKSGDMSDKYERDDYRAVEFTEEIARKITEEETQHA